MNEKSFLKTIFPMLNQDKDIIVGPGDDCAAVDVGDLENYYLLAVDQVISQVHFDPSTTLPEESGAKLIKRNISDIASMGGTPAHALVTLAVGSNISSEWIEKFYKGLSKEANKWNVSICGGDVALLKTSESFISTLTITGKVNRKDICLRKNMLPGDLLYVTGVFGNSYDTRHHLSFNPRVKEAGFLSKGYTNAMMDVSDGLLLDLQRMAEASNVSIKLNLDKIPSRTPKLPVKNIISDGEDYELIFSIKPSKEQELLKNWPFKDVKLTHIGEVVKFKDYFLFNKAGENLIQKYSKTGYDHFTKKI